MKRTNARDCARYNPGSTASYAEVVLYAFDLLFLDGRDLRSLPLNERRAALEKLFGKPASGAIFLSEEFDVAGATFFKIACERGPCGHGVKARRRV